MSTNDQAVEVRHNRDAQRFEATMDGHLCVADYRLGSGEIAFTHTYVPPELRGRGIAEKLVRAALNYAREQKLTIVPECWYVAAFMQRHPEYAGKG